MPIFGDIDTGGRPVRLFSSGGQLIGSAQVNGAQPSTWSVGGDLDKLDVEFSIEAWQALGGQPASDLGALRLLEAQLEELRSNPAMQPIYFQPFQTLQPSPVYPARSDSHDGWYWLEALTWDQESYNRRGAVDARATLTAVSTSAPAFLGLGWSGGSFSGSYTTTGVPLLGYPIGSTQQVPTAFTRVGGEGTIPLSLLSGSSINPAYFARPGTVAALYTGGVKVYDTVTAGGNAVPAAGAGFANTNWVRVYGPSPSHNITGDLIVTNGLHLLRFNQGGIGAPDIYVWNTQGTAGWLFWASAEYKDSPSFNVGTIRSLDLELVGLQAARVRAVLGTSAGNYAVMTTELKAGQYGGSILKEPRTQADAQAFALDLVWQTAYKVVANEFVAHDLSAGSTNLQVTTGAGWSVAISSTANQPIGGLGWQTPPSHAQPAAGSTTDIGYGDDIGSAVNVPERYFFWAAPFVTAEKLLAEAESGTLDAGWTSTADGGASGGNTAKCASGTVSGRADKWGAASFVPTPYQYLPGTRVKVTSAAGSAQEMTVGLWDDTSSIFVPLASTTYRANQLATSYGWIYTSWRRVTDGVLNGTTTVTSATAGFFSASDVGKLVSGAGIVVGTTISSVTNATTIVLSAAATATASGVTLTIGAAVTPTASHNMRMRAVTAATLGTDWFFDESALIAVRSATGADNAPEDIWRQLMFEVEASFT